MDEAGRELMLDELDADVLDDEVDATADDEGVTMTPLTFLGTVKAPPSAEDR